MFQFKQLPNILLFCLSSYASFSQNWLWAKNAIGVQGHDDYGHSVSCDSLNNVYMTGAFISQTCKFGTYTLTNPLGGPPTGPRNTFIAKYDPTGGVIWAKASTGNMLAGYPTSISCEKNGNCYIIGNFGQTISFGTFTLNSVNNSQDIYVAKLDKDGNFIWAVGGGGSSLDIARSISADNNGNIYIVGSFASTVLSVGTASISKTGIGSTFILKMDNNGNVIWLKEEGGPNIDEANFVTTDKQGNIIVGGQFDSPTLTIGSSTLTNFNTSNLFIAKYDALGNNLWAKCAAYSVESKVKSISTDDFGNIYFTGSFRDKKLSFGNNDTLYHNMYNSTGLWSSMFTLKLNSSGNLLWSRTPQMLFNSNWVEGFTITKRRNGVMVAGYHNGNPIAFSQYTLDILSNMGDCLYIVEYDSLGTVITATHVNSGSSTFNGSCTDYLGDSYVCGSFQQSPFVIGTNTLVYPGPVPSSMFIYLAKYSQQTVGLNEQTKKENFIKIYPNPAKDELFIETEVENTTLIVYSIIGQVVLNEKISGTNSKFNIEKLNNGTYLYKILDVNGQLIRADKIIINK